MTKPHLIETRHQISLGKNMYSCINTVNPLSKLSGCKRNDKPQMHKTLVIAYYMVNKLQSRICIILGVQQDWFYKFGKK